VIATSTFREQSLKGEGYPTGSGPRSSGSAGKCRTSRTAFASSRKPGELEGQMTPPRAVLAPALYLGGYTRHVSCSALRDTL
jgi:hypothetical protein